MITVNGKPVTDADGMPLTDYLTRQGYTLSRIAVEYNGDILSKALYADKMIEDGDSLEIVGFVGGG